MSFLDNRPQTQRPARNMNLDPRELERLIAKGQPGNVTGGSAGIPGILGGLNQQQNKPIMVPAFNPRMTTADLINQNTDSPNVVQPQGAAPGQNPVQKIMQQLQQLLINGPDGSQFQSNMTMPTFDPNRYKKQAETAVSSQFDPIIQQIMSMQKQTQGRAATNKQAVAGMYGEAVNQINAGAAQTQQGYDQSEAQSKQLYDDERNRIAAAYAADAASQRDQAKKLGTEALGVDQAIAAQTADKNFADQMGSQQMQSSQAAYGQQEQAAANYDKGIAQATGAEGMEQQTDIMRQLEDYMSQSNSDIASTRSQEAGAINDLMMQLANAAYQRDAQNTQFQYQQQRDAVGDANNVYDRQRQALMDQLQVAQDAQGSSGSDKLNPWQDVATFADQLQPGQGSDIVAAIQKAMNERGEIYARSKDDTPMNPALFAKLIADYPGNDQLNRNALMMAAQQLYMQLYGK